MKLKPFGTGQIKKNAAHKASQRFHRITRRKRQQFTFAEVAR